MRLLAPLALVALSLASPAVAGPTSESRAEAARKQACAKLIEQRSPRAKQECRARTVPALVDPTPIFIL